MEVLGTSGVQPATGDPGQVSGLTLPADACTTLTGLLTGVGGNGQAGAADTGDEAGAAGATADDSNAAAEAGPAPANVFVFIIEQSGAGQINIGSHDHDFTNGCGLDEAMQDTGVTVPVVEGGGSTPLQGVGDVSQVGLDSGHCWAMHNLFGSMHNAPSRADRSGGTNAQPEPQVSKTPAADEDVTTPSAQSTTPSATDKKDENATTPSAREDAGTSTTPTAGTNEDEDTTPSANAEDMTAPNEDATPSPTATRGTSDGGSSDSSSNGTSNSTSNGESQPLGEETPAP
jgi:hypothetical protein